MAMRIGGIGAPATGRKADGYGQWVGPGRRIRRYVGLKTALRSAALFLPVRRRDRAGCVDVRQSLVLADNLFRAGSFLPRRRARRSPQTA